jgi:glyoxylase I family protein
MTRSRHLMQGCAALLAALALGGCMSNPAPTARPQLATVRYQVADVSRSIDFYTGRLGFELEQRSGDAFAAVVRGDLRCILSGPGSSGSRPMPDGRRQEPGGWNRIVLYVDELDPLMRSLRAAGVRFRNEVETGPGGAQILIEDPDGNPLELHQPPARADGG